MDTYGSLTVEPDDVGSNSELGPHVTGVGAVSTVVVAWDLYRNLELRPATTSDRSTLTHGKFQHFDIDRI